MLVWIAIVVTQLNESNCTMALRCSCQRFCE